MDAATASARTEVARLDFVRPVPFHPTFERLMLHCSRTSNFTSILHTEPTFSKQKVSLIDIDVTIATRR